MLINFTDLPRNLTFREESGEISREIGLVPHRLRQIGHRRVYPHYHVCHAHHPLPPR